MVISEYPWTYLLDWKEHALSSNGRAHYYNRITRYSVHGSSTLKQKHLQFVERKVETFGMSGYSPTNNSFLGSAWSAGIIGSNTMSRETEYRSGTSPIATIEESRSTTASIPPIISPRLGKTMETTNPCE